MRYTRFLATFSTSGTHLGHAAMIRFGWPCGNVDEMDEASIEAWPSDGLSGDVVQPFSLFESVQSHCCTTLQTALLAVVRPYHVAEARITLEHCYRMVIAAIRFPVLAASGDFLTCCVSTRSMAKAHF